MAWIMQTDIQKPSNILWIIVAGLVVWTLVLAAGAYLGPRALPTGERIERQTNDAGEPVSLSPRATRNKMLRALIVVGSTAGLLGFWGVMFALRARRLAKKAPRFSNEPGAKPLVDASPPSS